MCSAENRRWQGLVGRPTPTYEDLTSSGTTWSTGGDAGRPGSIVDEIMETTDLPTILTIEEAAGVLRVSRATAYSLARRWLAGDPNGLPVVRVGRSLRVPGHAIRTALAEPGESEDRSPVVKRVAIRMRTHRPPTHRRQHSARS
jgi:excisionase family DNA binding protein